VRLGRQRLEARPARQLHAEVKKLPALLVAKLPEDFARLTDGAEVCVGGAVVEADEASALGLEVEEVQLRSEEIVCERRGDERVRAVFGGLERDGLRPAQQNRDAADA